MSVSQATQKESVQGWESLGRGGGEYMEIHNPPSPLSGPFHHGQCRDISSTIQTRRVPYPDGETVRKSRTADGEANSETGQEDLDWARNERYWTERNSLCERGWWKRPQRRQWRDGLQERTCLYLISVFRVTVNRRMLTALSLLIAYSWKQQEPPSIGEWLTKVRFLCLLNKLSGRCRFRSDDDKALDRFQQQLSCFMASRFANQSTMEVNDYLLSFIWDLFFICWNVF